MNRSNLHSRTNAERERRRFSSLWVRAIPTALSVRFEFADKRPLPQDGRTFVLRTFMTHPQRLTTPRVRRRITPFTMLFALLVVCSLTRVGFGEVNTCGGIYSQQQFVIETPNYPGNYPNGVDCLYIFKGPYCESVYTLQFLDFNLEESLGCSGDRLEIRDKDALCGRLDGTKRYTTKTGTLELNFISNSAISARGFRILVSRSSCNSNGILTTTEYPTAHNNFIPDRPRTCCANSYSDKRFYLASPGFPYNNYNQDCAFTIHRANSNICRLRIRLNYFWVGEQNYGCTSGYLQIDGKLLCGCQTELKLISPFDGSQGETKMLYFKNIASQRNKRISGFAMEIIQDDCPKRYSPAENFVLPANVIKHFYFYSGPDFYGDYDVEHDNRPREIEQTTYIDTPDLQSFSTNSANYEKCLNWGDSQWTSLYQDPNWARMPKCNLYASDPALTKCNEFSSRQGYFLSPGYPYQYPPHLNICYRFSKQPGICKIRLVMHDFHLENSFDCRKDFLLFSGNYRYCGQSLSNTFTLLDVSHKNYEELRFVSDGFISGRGFRGVYEQIPCAGLTYPNNVITTDVPLHSRTEAADNMSSNVSCATHINDDIFTIDIYDYGKKDCMFVICRNNETVCGVELDLITFDFPCESEYILIENKRYCGNLTGQKLKLDFVNDRIKIAYNTSNMDSNVGLKLHMLGRQTSCKIPLPEVQRIAFERRNFIQQNNTMITDVIKNKDDISVILKKQYGEVCGVVMSVKEAKASESICNIILNKRRNVECNPLTGTTIYVPYNESDRLELKFKNVETVQDIEFKEITCDNKFVM